MILDDGLEKRALAKEAVEVFREVEKLLPHASQELQVAIFSEVMTNIRGVSMRRGR